MTASKLPLIALLSLLAFSPVQAKKAEKRCGWLENPSPANHWLIDADGEWTLSVQGTSLGEDIGIGQLPPLNSKDSVRTNGEYGFACVCLQLDTDPVSHTVLKIYGGKQLPLKQCLEDPAIRGQTPIH